MHKSRVEAFSDGVFAIIITIMVLELKVPEHDTLESLLPLAPKFLSYILSFIYVGIYWNNHHHTFQLVKHVDGSMLWPNMHLLFWLSLTPFVTAWSGENHFAAVPVALYGFVLFMAAMAYMILLRSLAKRNNAELKEALGRDKKGKLSNVLYAVAIPLAFVSPYISLFIYVAVAVMWVIPDSRVEKVIAH